VGVLRFPRARATLICIWRSDLGLPGVNLNLYMDDLRMMAPKPVAARESGMKQYEDYRRNYLEGTSIQSG
jgi:hypothetical protein